MTGIGLRVHSNSRVYYSIIEELNGQLNYKDVSHLSVPMSINKPERLSFIRNTLLDILNEYKIERAGIRVSESMKHVTQNTIERHYIEGVIQESLASSVVDKYVAGQIARITGILNIERSAFKKYADAEERFPNIPTNMDWDGLKLEERESIIVCNCCLAL